MLEAMNGFQFGGIVYNIGTLDKRFSYDNKLMTSHMKMTMATILYVLCKCSNCDIHLNAGHHLDKVQLFIVLELFLLG